MSLEARLDALQERVNELRKDYADFRTRLLALEAENLEHQTWLRSNELMIRSSYDSRSGQLRILAYPTGYSAFAKKDALDEEQDTDEEQEADVLRLD